MLPPNAFHTGSLASKVMTPLDSNHVTPVAVTPPVVYPLALACSLVKSARTELVRVLALDVDKYKANLNVSASMSKVPSAAHSGNLLYRFHLPAAAMGQPSCVAGGVGNGGATKSGATQSSAI